MTGAISCFDEFVMGEMVETVDWCNGDHAARLGNAGQVSWLTLDYDIGGSLWECVVGFGCME